MVNNLHNKVWLYQKQDQCLDGMLTSLIQFRGIFYGNEYVLCHKKNKKNYKCRLFFNPVESLKCACYYPFKNMRSR